VNLFQLVQDSIPWRCSKNMMLNFWVPPKQGISLPAE